MTPAELRGIREMTGHSIEDLARSLSVSRSIIQKWEGGTSPIPAGVADDMNRLRDTYADARDATLDAAPASMEVWRSDRDSWHETGRPARWWRQIAAECHMTHGTTVTYLPLAGHDPMVLVDEANA